MADVLETGRTVDEMVHSGREVAEIAAFLTREMATAPVLSRAGGECIGEGRFCGIRK